MRHGLAVCAAGLVLSGCYLSHPGHGRDGGSPLDGLVLFDGLVDFDADMPPFDADVPPFDGLVGLDVDAPPFDGDVPPFDASRPDASRPDASRPDASRPDATAGDSGRPSPALRMSATTFMEVEDSPVFDTPFDHSFELWVRSREGSDADFCRKGDGSASHFYAGQRGGRVVMGWQVFPDERFVIGPVLTRDRWTHLALVVTARPDGAHAAELFVDGTSVDRLARAPNLLRTFNDVEFICGNSDFDVDEIRMWSVVRSETQIRMNMTNRIAGSIPGMVAYWRLDEAGQIALDWTARGNVGVLGRLTRVDPADPTWILDGPF